LVSQGKLVRDKIPQIIRAKGLEPVMYVAGAQEYATRLRDKLTPHQGDPARGAGGARGLVHRAAAGSG
jgi:hypothetical protein